MAKLKDNGHLDKHNFSARAETVAKYFCLVQRYRGRLTVIDTMHVTLHSSE